MILFKWYYIMFSLDSKTVCTQRCHLQKKKKHFKNENIGNGYEQGDFTKGNLIDEPRNIEISQNTVDNDIEKVDDSYYNNEIQLKPKGFEEKKIVGSSNFNEGQFISR